MSLSQTVLKMLTASGFFTADTGGLIVLKVDPKAERYVKTYAPDIPFCQDTSPQSSLVLRGQRAVAVTGKTWVQVAALTTPKRTYVEGEADIVASVTKEASAIVVKVTKWRGMTPREFSKVETVVTLLWGKPSEANA